MTGAGSATLAADLEDSFLGTVAGSPFKFGRDPTEQDVSLDNQLQRLHEPDSVWSVESVKENFEGAFGVEAVVNAATFPNVEDLVFNGTDGSGNKAIVSGRPQSATVYVGVDYLDGTTERALEGFIPTEFTIDYNEDDQVRFTLTGIYAQEATATSITPSNITGPSTGGTAASHDFDLSIDTTSISKLQSASLTISNIARFQRDGGPTPADIVVAQPEATLQSTAIITGPSRLERALGSAGATTTEDRIGGVPATISIDNDGTTISDYNLATLKPTNLGWSDVVAGDSDTMETVQWHVDGDNAVTVA